MREYTKVVIHGRDLEIYGWVCDQCQCDFKFVPAGPENNIHPPCPTPGCEGKTHPLICLGCIDDLLVKEEE